MQSMIAEQHIDCSHVEQAVQPAQFVASVVSVHEAPVLPPPLVAVPQMPGPPLPELVLVLPEEDVVPLLLDGGELPLDELVVLPLLELALVPELVVLPELEVLDVLPLVDPLAPELPLAELLAEPLVLPLVVPELVPVPLADPLVLLVVPELPVPELLPRPELLPLAEPLLLPLFPASVG